MTDIAFLGTGIMGRAMAARLLGAGFDVRAWNRTRAKAEPLAELGATVVDTPAAAVEGAAVVITMLNDADAVLDTMAGALPAVSADAVWLQMSTVGVAGCARVAAAAREAGVAFVDAPVLGTRAPAEQGTLKILAAGPAALRERCEPVFAPLGKLSCWLDEVGQASALKLVVNSWILAITDAAATSITLAQRLGIEPQLFLDTIAGTMSDTAYLQLKGAAILRGDFAPSFAVSGAAKDAGLIVSAARDAGYDAELVDIVRRHFERAAERGHAGDDMAAIYFGQG